MEQNNKIKSHLLSTLKSSAIPNRLIFFDTESYINTDYNNCPFQNGMITPVNCSSCQRCSVSVSLPFRMGWCCYINYTHRSKNTYEQWEFFNNKTNICDYIVGKTYKKTCLYVFAHNIYHDLRCIDFFSYADKNKWTIKKFIDKGTSSFLKIVQGEKSIIFLSTTNFFKYSLEELGKSIGITKKTVDFNSDSEESISEYCRQDVNIIKKIMIDFFDYLSKNNLGGFRITAASQAMGSYRYRFMRNKIFPVDDTKIINIERESYHGGRTECFRLGNLSKNNVYVYDINSMYPYVMRQYMYPTYACDYIENSNIKNLKYYLKEYCMIAKITIKTNEPVYCYNYNNRVIFPVGIFTTVLTTPEIQYAFVNNQIMKIHYIVLYYKKNIFQEYVDFFYQEKLKYKNNNNKAYTTLIKLFLNSLYGKFGQQGYDQDIIVNYNLTNYKRERIIDLVTGKMYWKTDIMNTEIIDTDGEKPRHTFVSIASHVTAYARMYLWTIINIAGMKNVYYCDTDSVFVSQEGKNRLCGMISESELGKLKLESRPYELRIYGLKDYVIDGKIKIKGIRKNAIKLGENTWKQQQFDSLKASIKNRHIDQVNIKYVIKHMKRVYTKGKVCGNGIIKPFRICIP